MTRRIIIADTPIGMVRLIYGSWLMRAMHFFPWWRSFVGLTINRTIRFGPSISHPASAPLLRHEYAHVGQWVIYGRLGFTVRYLWQCLRYGYEHAPLEQEARYAEWSAQNPFTYRAVSE